MNSMSLKVQLLNENAKLPTKGTKDSAGYDLYACLDSRLPLAILPKERVVVPTGIAITTPEGTYARIAPRSGLAVKHGLDVGAGVVDHDYVNEVGVVLFNFGDKTYLVNHGDRIAQMIITPYYTPEIIKVDRLANSDRKGGFGSTGQ